MIRSVAKEDSAHSSIRYYYMDVIMSTM